MKFKRLVMFGIMYLSLASVVACGNEKANYDIEEEVEISTNDLESNVENTEEEVEISTNDLENSVENIEQCEVIRNSQSAYLRDGEWLYFNDGEYLKRMKVDGSYTQTLNKKSEVCVESEGCFLYGGICIIEDWVYFPARSEDYDDFGIARIKKDGSEWEYISEHYGYYDGKYVFGFDDNGIYRATVEEEKETIIAYINNIESLIGVIDGYIYYYSEDKSVRRVKIESSEEEIILTKDEYSYKLLSSDGWIYYYQNIDDPYGEYEKYNGSVYRKKLDGSQKEVVYSRGSSLVDGIKICGNSIYCTYEDYSETNIVFPLITPIVIIVSKEGNEVEQYTFEDIKNIDITYPRTDGKVGYYDIGFSYIDEEYVIFSVVDDEDGRYDSYISDIKGTNIIKIK